MLMTDTIDQLQSQTHCVVLSIHLNKIASSFLTFRWDDSIDSDSLFIQPHIIQSQFSHSFGFNIMGLGDLH